MSTQGELYMDNRPSRSWFSFKILLSAQPVYQAAPNIDILSVSPGLVHSPAPPTWDLG